MQTLHVLLVEDDADDYLLTCHMLEDIHDPHFIVERADTFESGMDRLLDRDASYDICLVDYRLGARTGIDLIRDITRKGVPTPLILFTGQGDETLAVSALKLGARDYLVKGLVTPKALKRAITNAIARATLERQLAEHRAELERTNRELERKNADIRSFHHTVSHELKNPLAAAREFAAIMAEGLAGPLSDDQAEYVGIIRDNCDQMATMIDDLLDASRLENGKLTLNRQPVKPDELIPSIVQSMTPAATEKGLTLRCQTAGNLPRIEADPARLRQVVGNLIGNAIKFTPSGGTITVALSPDAERPAFLRIAVTDSGVGIPPEQLERIFQRFYQADDRRDQGKGGLGLGLAICKGIVDLHGGHIQVTSQLDRGSTFSCLIPVGSGSAASPSP